MSGDDSLQGIGELGGLVPDADNFVTIFVDGARLQPGRYRLAIVGDPDTDASDKESAFILRTAAPVQRSFRNVPLTVAPLADMNSV